MREHDASLEVSWQAPQREREAASELDDSLCDLGW